MSRCFSPALAALLFVICAAGCDENNDTGSGLLIVSEANPANGNGTFKVTDAHSVGSDEPSIIGVKLVGPDNYEAQLTLSYDADHPEQTSVEYVWGPEGCVEAASCFLNADTFCSGADCGVSIDYSTRTITFVGTQVAALDETSALIYGSVTFLRR